MPRLPALPTAVFLAAGIASADLLPGTRTAFLPLLSLVVAAAAATCIAGRLGFVYAAGTARFVVAALMLLLCGIAAYVRSVHLGGAVWSTMIESEQPVEIVGRVIRTKAVSSGLRVELHGPVRLPEGLALPGRIQAYVDSAGTAELAAGTIVSIIGRVTALPRKRNPSDFDYGRYLRRRGFRAVVVADGRPLALESPHRLGRFFSMVRGHVRRGINATVRDPNVRSILSALLIGDRNDIDPSLRRQFVESGLIHLLAVSGLHVMVVGFLFYNISGPLLRRVGMRWAAVETVRVVTTAGVLLTYMEITGRPDSVVRAVIMACFLISSPLLRRNASSLNALLAAVVIILVVSPSSLFEAGFQLSVAAVGVIIAFHPLLVSTHALHRLSTFAGKSVASIASVTIAATLGVTPVLLWHFGEMSVAGLLLNLPAIPLTTGALVAGAIGAALVALPDPVAPFGGLYFRASEIAAHLVAATAEFGSSKLALVIRTSPDIFSLTAISLIVFAVCMWRSRVRWLIIAAALASLAAVRWHDAARQVRKRTEIVFFDVGHGDAALLTTSAGTTMLVDAGDRPQRSKIAVRSVIAHLHRNNVRKLDLVVLSHAHSDHIGAMASLLRRVAVRRIVYSGTPAASRSLERIWQLADSTHVEISTAGLGDTLRLDATVTVQILWPHRDRMPFLDENNRSLVVRVVAAGGVILFTGDIEREAEWEVVRSFGPILTADILKVPHHGSSTSSTTPFVRAIGAARTQHAIVSVASRNSYGLPDEAVVSRWRREGLLVHRTDLNRAAWFAVDRRGVKVRSWK